MSPASCMAGSTRLAPALQLQEGAWLMHIRHVAPADYTRSSRASTRSGTDARCALLPKLFFMHFCDTRFIAEHDQTIIGFLIGFLSQTFPDEAYIHFVGIHPAFRRQHIGRTLYTHFFEVVEQRGRHVVRCVTSPINIESIAFHMRLGFAIESHNTGAGEHRVLGVAVLRNARTPQPAHNRLSRLSE